MSHFQTRISHSGFRGESGSRDSRCRSQHRRRDFALQAFLSEAKIVAIKPDSGNFAVLTRIAGADDGIRLLKSGLWSHKCRLHVIAGESAEGFRAEEVNGEPQPGDVDAVSIASIMQSFGLDEIDILKMDIEGAEYQAFTAPDVESWIRRVKVLIFECPDADRPGTTQAIFEKLAGLDFVCHIHGECFVLIRSDTGWKLESNTYL